MNRRGFLTGMLALGVAPAIVRAESLMRIVVPTTAEFVRYGHYGAIKISEWESFEAEMAALTRRAFIPRMVVQIYDESPTLSLLLKTARR